LVHRKMSFRERPAITVAANLTVRDGRIERARLAVGSIGVVPQRLTGAEECLLGLDATDPELTPLGPCLETTGRQAEPVQDANGSVEYKRQLVRVMVERCVRAALLEASS
jgi:carbon-monoxide dehydrogenase medium subunit